MICALIRGAHVAAALAVVASLGALILRMGRRSGVMNEELRGPLPGDDFIPRSYVVTDRAITIKAPPEEVWPWVVQMGYHRGGWYTSRRLDKILWHIDNPSEDRIVPEYQNVQVGDIIPDGEPGKAYFTVAEIEQDRHIVYLDNVGSHVPGITFSWAFVLRPLTDGSTRIQVRWRNGPISSFLMRIVVRLLVAPADFVMMNQVLGGIKQRAERARESRTSASSLGGTHSSAVVVEEEVDIKRSPEEVFDYCADLTHEPEWNPKMTRIEKLTDGLIGLGTQYEAEFVPSDPMVIEYLRFDRPTAWTTVGESRRLRAIGEGRVLPTKDGARLLLRMELAPRGLLWFARPLLRRYMQPQLKRDLATIKGRLEASAEPALSEPTSMSSPPGKESRDDPPQDFDASSGSPDGSACCAVYPEDPSLAAGLGSDRGRAEQAPAGRRSRPESDPHHDSRHYDQC